MTDFRILGIEEMPNGTLTGRLERKANNELGETLFRIENILNYYQSPDGKDRLVDENIEQLKDVCNLFFSIRSNFDDKYGIDIGMWEERWTGEAFTDSSHKIKYIPDNYNKNKLNINPELLDSYSNLYRVVAEFREKKLELLLRNKEIIESKN